MKIKNKSEKHVVIFAVLVFTLLMWFLKMPCIFKTLFKIECLGCGMTRAIISMFKFDFSSAYLHHKMFWSLPILALYFLFDGKLFKNKIINITVLVLIGVGFILNWLF